MGLLNAYGKRLGYTNRVAFGIVWGMKTWSPLWSSIVVSSLWSEPSSVRIVFLTMMALKDSQGVVTASLPGLQRLSNITLEETVEALRVLSSPDTLTTDPQEYDGRRIERVDGGWRVLNHFKYREEVSKELKRQRDARAQSKWRAKQSLKKQGRPLAGESDYVNAAKAGASVDELNGIVTRNLPRGK